MPKIFVQGKQTILGPKMAHLHNCGLACRMKGANRYMKTLLLVFQEKNSFRAI